MFHLFRKKPKKSGSNQPAPGKGAASSSSSEKGASAATAAAGGKTSARPTLISARGPTAATDRPTTKLETTAAEENEKYEIKLLQFSKKKKKFFSEKELLKANQNLPLKKKMMEQLC